MHDVLCSSDNSVVCNNCIKLTISIYFFYYYIPIYLYPYTPTYLYTYIPIPLYPYTPLGELQGSGGRAHRARHRVHGRQRDGADRPLQAIQD
jgi:hypothetical protein